MNHSFCMFALARGAIRYRCKGLALRKKCKMKRICVYCEKWSSGGIESFLFNTMTHINREDAVIDIVAARIEESVFTEKLRSYGIGFFELAGNRNCMVRNRKLFLTLARKRNYDVIHVNAFHGGEFYYLYLAKRLGISVRIAHGHCAGLNSKKHAWLKKIVHECSKKIFVRYATELWACSRAAAAFMYPKGRRSQDKCRIIPNGIDIDRFRFRKEQRVTVRRKMGLNDQLVIGTVGRLCQEKNQIFLLDVFLELLKLHPNSKLLLVGEGPEHNRLIQHAKELGIDSNTIFYGTTDHVEQLLWAMDVFVFPSLVEGLGLAAIEAQAAGLPVLCSDAIPAETYILSTMRRMSLKGSAEQWAKLLVDLWRNDEYRESCADIVREKGLNILDIAEYIATVYKNNV